MMTDKMKQRFCKHYDLKINLYEDPYFEDRVRLFGYDNEYQNYKMTIETHFQGNETKYFTYCSQLADAIRDRIKNSKVYQEMSSWKKDDLLLYPCNIDGKDELPNQIINHSKYVGHRFVEIELYVPIFSALVNYGLIHNIPLHNNYNWVDFLYSYDLSLFGHLVSSKYMEQVILGPLNCKAIAYYNRHLMCTIVNTLLYHTKMNVDDIVTLSSDKIIIDITNWSKELLKSVYDQLESIMDMPQYKVEEFVLGKICGTSGYVKKIRGHGGDFYLPYQCNSNEVIYLYRYLAGEPIQKNDLLISTEYGTAQLLCCPELSLLFDPIPQDS